MTQLLALRLLDIALNILIVTLSERKDSSYWPHFILDYMCVMGVLKQLA